MGNSPQACPVCAGLFFIDVKLVPASKEQVSLNNPTFQCANCRAIVEQQKDFSLMVVSRIR